MKQADRNAKTQQIIKEAFIDLINEKGFNNLTVSDITRAAGVSRGTFYVHYTDKYELLTKIEDELVANITHALSENLDEPLTKHTAEEISGSTYLSLTRRSTMSTASASPCGHSSHQMVIPNSSTVSKIWLTFCLPIS